MKALIGFLVMTICSISVLAQQVEFLHPQVIELGKATQGEELEGIIQFINNGSEPVEIEAIKPSCGCTAVTPGKMIYASGEMATIPFTIKTANFSGVIRKSIKVIFKNTEPKTYSFFAQANVVTDLNFSPKFVNFFQVKLNPDTTITEYFEIENTTDQEIEVTKIYTDSKFIRIAPVSVVIPSGRSHLVQVELTPSETGRHNTQVHIESNNEKEKEKNLPVYIYVLDSAGKGS